MKKCFFQRVILLGIAGLLTAHTTLAQEIGAMDEPEFVQIYLGESFKLNVKEVTKVVISDPEIVEVVPVTSEVLVLNAKKAGTTTLTLFEKDQERVIRVLVAQNDVALAMRIKTAIGYPGVKVLVAEQNIVLEGEVEDQDERNRAVTLASAFLAAVRGGAAAAPANNVFNNTTFPRDNTSEGDVADATSYSAPTPTGIIDFLRIRNQKQIKLRIQVVRMSKSATKDFGIRYDDEAGWSAGFISGGEGPNTALDENGTVRTDGAFGPFGRALGFGTFGGSDDTTFDIGEQTANSGYAVRLRTLEAKGDVKTLARPVITTLDGAEASFLAGGKVIIVSSSAFGDTTQTEEFGVKIFFRPKIMPNGNINLFITPKVSEIPQRLNTGSDASFVIPSRNTRNTVEVPNGATVVLAGLFQFDKSLNINKFPWLANIPIIGELFKNRVNDSSEQELGFFVTPEIIGNPQIAAVGPDLATETGDYKAWLQDRRVFSSMNPNIPAKGPKFTTRDYPDAFPDKKKYSVTQEVDPRATAIQTGSSAAPAPNFVSPDASEPVVKRSNKPSSGVIQEIPLSEAEPAVVSATPSSSTKTKKTSPATAPVAAAEESTDMTATNSVEETDNELVIPPPTMQEQTPSSPTATTGEQPLMNLPRPAAPKLQPR